MSRSCLRFALILALPFVLAACRVSVHVETHADPAAAVETSARKFNDAWSYRMQFTLNSPDGPSEGEGAYRLHTAAFTRVSYNGGEVAGDEVAGYLFLPPDLYLQMGDGSWVVRSPWNQGSPPGEENRLGLEEPLINFVDLAAGLQNLEQGRDEDLDGEATRLYRAEVDLSTLPLTNGAYTGHALVQLWIDKASELPRRVQLGTSSPGGFVVSVDYSNYNEEVSWPDPPAGATPIRNVQFPDAPCIGAELAGCLEAEMAIQPTGSCDGRARRVCIVPLGKVPPGLIDHLVTTYRDLFDLTVTIMPPAAIPDRLVDPEREQIDADSLIDYMGELYPDAYRDPQAVMIGLTPIDLYSSTSHFRYVFGMKGTAADPKAVVSGSRMNPLFYSEPTNDLLFYARTRKLVSKYVGLLYYGLPPSSDPSSPLFDSILGPADVDNMSDLLPINGSL